MNYKSIQQAFEDNQQSTLMRKYKIVFEQIKEFHGEDISDEKLSEIALGLVRIDHDYVI